MVEMCLMYDYEQFQILPLTFRSAVEEVYAKSLLKLAKSATQVTQLG